MYLRNFSLKKIYFIKVKDYKNIKNKKLAKIVSIYLMSVFSSNLMNSHNTVGSLNTLSHMTVFSNINDNRDFCNQFDNICGSTKNEELTLTPYEVYKKYHKNSTITVKKLLKLTTNLEIVISKYGEHIQNHIENVPSCLLVGILYSLGGISEVMKLLESVSEAQKYIEEFEILDVDRLSKSNNILESKVRSLSNKIINEMVCESTNPSFFDKKDINSYATLENILKNIIIAAMKFGNAKLAHEEEKGNCACLLNFFEEELENYRVFMELTEQKKNEIKTELIKIVSDMLKLLDFSPTLMQNFNGLPHSMKKIAEVEKNISVVFMRILNELIGISSIFKYCIKKMPQIDAEEELKYKDIIKNIHRKTSHSELIIFEDVIENLRSILANLIMLFKKSPLLQHLSDGELLATVAKNIQFFTNDPWIQNAIEIYIVDINIKSKKTDLWNQYVFFEIIIMKEINLPLDYESVYKGPRKRQFSKFEEEFINKILSKPTIDRIKTEIGRNAEKLKKRFKNNDGQIHEFFLFKETKRKQEKTLITDLYGSLDPLLKELEQFLSKYYQIKPVSKNNLKKRKSMFKMATFLIIILLFQIVGICLIR